MDEYRPSWIRTEIQRSELNDETDIVQLGTADQTHFNTMLFQEPQPSGWDKFPTD